MLCSALAFDCKTYTFPCEIAGKKFELQEERKICFILASENYGNASEAKR